MKSNAKLHLDALIQLKVWTAIKCFLYRKWWGIRWEPWITRSLNHGPPRNWLEWDACRVVAIQICNYNSWRLPGEGLLVEPPNIR